MRFGAGAEAGISTKSRLTLRSAAVPAILLQFASLPALLDICHPNRLLDAYLQSRYARRGD